MSKSGPIVIGLALGAALLSSSVFVVGEREKAIKLALGEIQTSDYTPGLHFKMPVYNTVHKFDSRLITLDAAPERVLTSEKKNVIVDSFVKWRIGDVEQYFKSTGGDERRARTLLSQFVRKAVLDEFGRHTVREVVSEDRDELLKNIISNTSIEADRLGIDLVDVRVKKVELPPDVSDAVYSRMEKERATVAKAFRSRGDEQAKGIRADADRQREEILATAYAESEQIRGEGDAQAAEIYSTAFSQEPEFYRLVRSLNAYRDVFKGQSDVLVLKPDAEFFRYFNNPANTQEK